MIIPGYSEFELDIERILREQLPPYFDQVEPAALTLENIRELPVGAKGAYILLEGENIVYAGKTDASHGFRNRLERHFYSVQHRMALDPANISFKAVRIFVFSALDIESLLIDELKRRVEASLSWNFSGYGSNDPGRRRDGQEPAKFDLDHPIDVNRGLEIPGGHHKAVDLLNDLKIALPYLLRYDSALAKNRRGRGEYDDVVITLPSDGMSTIDIIRAVVDGLPGGPWQATVLPGRVILYQERKEYEFASYIIRRGEIEERRPHK